MNVLALDTCMTACSVALLDRAGTTHSRFEVMERGHAEALFPMIEAVMAESGLDFAELDRLAVTRGPGTFTGVRAGIAAVRGLALGCGAPVVSATSLEIMALGYLAKLGAAACKNGFLIAHDARRGELYVQLFDAGARALTEPSLATPEIAAALAVPHKLVAGSGAALVAAADAGAGLRAALPALLPDAAYLAQWATRAKPLDIPASPLYLRAPDAKPQMDKHLARI